MQMSAWLICGDFNLIRKIFENFDKYFDFKISSRFNLLISTLELYEFSLSNRKYTWSKSIHSDSFVLLDKFFYTLFCSSHFDACVVKSLPLVQSDHTPLVLYSHK
jgi:hypothetical protein